MEAEDGSIRESHLVSRAGGNGTMDLPASIDAGSEWHTCPDTQAWFQRRGDGEFLWPLCRGVSRATQETRPQMHQPDRRLQKTARRSEQCGQRCKGNGSQLCLYLKHAAPGGAFGCRRT